ncbi:MAG: hypothetical protein ABIP48_18535, partial [Planctomycetota bacterium]
MSNSLPPTADFLPSPNDWRPPRAELPDPFSHITLKELRGEAMGRHVWSAVSKKIPGKLLIVEFLMEMPPSLCTRNTGRSRFAIDLQLSQS